MLKWSSHASQHGQHHRYRPFGSGCRGNRTADGGIEGIGIVDLKGRRLIRTVSGFAEPQGIAYSADTDTIFVANGGDGSVRLFSGADFTALEAIRLGVDADNVRIDRSTHFVYVGYGNAALAVIDARTRQHVADIPLEGHPEGFAPAGVRTIHWHSRMPWVASSPSSDNPRICKATTAARARYWGEAKFARIRTTSSWMKKGA